MKQTVEEAARKYADENCWIPEELHDSEIPDYIEHFAKHFMAGAEWERQKAIEAFKFATDGYFIIGGTDYSANRLSEFIEKLNS